VGVKKLLSVRDRSIEISGEENDDDAAEWQLILQETTLATPLPSPFPLLSNAIASPLSLLQAHPQPQSSQNSTQPQLNQHTVAAAC
jgi:hypothetical protein